MHFILDLIADSTPRGAFSTIIASDGFKLNFSSAVLKGSGSGFPSFKSSPVIFMSKSFFLFFSMRNSTFCLEDPLTIAFKQLLQFKEFNKSSTPSNDLAF